MCARSTVCSSETDVPYSHHHLPTRQRHSHDGGSHALLPCALHVSCHERRERKKHVQERFQGLCPVQSTLAYAMRPREQKKQAARATHSSKMLADPGYEYSIYKYIPGIMIIIIIPAGNVVASWSAIHRKRTVGLCTTVLQYGIGQCNCIISLRLRGHTTDSASSSSSSSYE